VKNCKYNQNNFDLNQAESCEICDSVNPEICSVCEDSNAEVIPNSPSSLIENGPLCQCKIGYHEVIDSTNNNAIVTRCEQITDCLPNTTNGQPLDPDRYKLCSACDKTNKNLCVTCTDPNANLSEDKTTCLCKPGTSITEIDDPTSQTGAKIKICQASCEQLYPTGVQKCDTCSADDNTLCESCSVEFAVLSPNKKGCMCPTD